jgi:hypothetical protein
MKPLKILKNPPQGDESEIHLNARAKNCSFKSLSIDIFNRMFIYKTANEIWLKLYDPQDDNTT